MRDFIRHIGPYKAIYNENEVFVLSLLIFCCGTRLMYSPEELSRESNAELIEKAVKDASAQIITIPFLDKKNNYVVISSESPEDQDAPMTSLIEDAMIASMSESGFSVLERDKDVLLRVIYQEDKEKMKSAVLPPESVDKEGGSKTAIPKYDLDYGKKVQIIPTQITPEVGSQNVFTADYLINYRILETGLKYIKVNERDEYGMRQMKREALVKLSVRLIDAKTSKVVWGGNLSGHGEDYIPAWQKEKLKKTGYQFYPFTSPLQDAK